MRPMSIFTPDSVAVRCTVTAAGRAEFRGLETGLAADNAAQQSDSHQCAQPLRSAECKTVAMSSMQLPKAQTAWGACNAAEKK